MAHGTNTRSGWKRVFRQGFAPLLSTAVLETLRRALETEDPCLVQGTTAHPRDEQEPVCAACPLGYAGWRGEGLATVGAVNRYFSRLCAAADERLGESAACVDFLNFVDDTPLVWMRKQLLEEVTRILAQRPQTMPTAAA